MFLCLLFYSQHKVFAESDIDGFTSQLQTINSLYGDKVDCRLIVKSDYRVQEKKAISIATGLGDLHILQFETREDAENAREKLKKQKGIKSVDFDKQVSLEEVQEQSFKTERGEEFLSWGSDILGIKDYQNHILANNHTLKDVYVVVIDTGIDTNHEFLQGRINIEYGKSFATSISTASDYPFEDDQGHGTHVAGIIADLTLDNVKIIPVKALNSMGFGAMSGIESAMEYSVVLKTEHNLNIVATNMSLGGEGEVETRMKDLIDLAFENNILTVVAAGNSSYYAETEFPGASSNALTISALTSNSLYSRFPFIANYSNYGSVIDLCLPGTSILSCVPDDYDFKDLEPVVSDGGFKYASLSGTSMATPHASALVALIATNMGDEFSAQKAEEMLKNNAYDFGDEGKDDLYGYGVPYLNASIEDVTFTQPQLSYGEFGKTNTFDQPFNLEITYPAENYTIRYSVDGSIPTFNNDAGDGHIQIKESSLIRIIVYKLDENSPTDMSPIYEVEYLQNGHELNDNGVGFSITQAGVINGYRSGLRDIVLPREINGITVKKLANNVFYGLSIRSFVCEFDVECGDFPFWSCDRLQYLKLFTTNASKITRFCFSLKELYLPKLNAILPSPNMKYSSYTNTYNGSETFSKCFNLKTIDLSSLSIVPDFAFSGYRKLENIILDWDNLKEIQSYAFHDTKVYNGNITSYMVENIGECAFFKSGIIGFNGKNVENVGKNAFSDCSKLLSIQLPNVKSLGASIVSGTNNLNYMMIGPYLSQSQSNSLQTDSNMTIYCYDTSLPLFNKFKTVSLNPQIAKIDAPQLQVNLTGYDLRLKVYKSSDEILDQNDLQIKDETFSGVNINTSYIYDELFIGEFYYIFVLSDRFDNSVTTAERYLYEAKQSHKLTINSNVDGCGIISPKSYYTEGEEVSIVNHELYGYELIKVTLDGQEISVDGRYTFFMPDHDVEINVEYLQIHYTITTLVEGNGEIKVKDESGQEIESATFGQKVYVEFTPNDGYYLDSAFYIASGLKEEITRKEYFLMPCVDIKIIAYYLSPMLEDFEFVARGDGKIGIRKYTGNDEYVYIPQYHIMNGQTYRVVSIAEGCFMGNTTLKSVSMEFEDDNTDITIETSAFSGCVNLERVAVGRIVKVGNRAFMNCASLSIIDLSFCQEIGDNAFNNCQLLKQVNLKSCGILGKQAFTQGGLTKVTGFKVENVPESAFSQNSGLISINLSNCKSIEKNAFQNTGLKNIDLSKCMILGEGGGQFQACLSLSSVKNLIASELPSNIFAQCYSLNDINLSEVTTIRSGAFSGCRELCEINLKNVDTLERGAFDDSNILRVYLDRNSKLFNNDFPKVGYVYLNKNSLPSTIPTYYAFNRDFDDYIVYSHANAYVVTFKFNGETIISKDLYCSDDLIIVPKTYTDTQYTYTLNSWYIEGDNTFTVQPGDIRTVSMDTTYVAKNYDTDNITCEIIYYYGYDYDNSGEINDEGDIFVVKTAKKGEHIILPTEIITREKGVDFEYLFEGWTVDGDLIDNSFIVNGDLTIIAKYSQTKRKYMVSWLNSDGSVIYSEMIEYGQIPQFDLSKPLPQSYKDEGYRYTFSGWGELLPITGDVRISPKFTRELLTYQIYFYYGYDYNNNGVNGDDGDIFEIVDFNLNSMVVYPKCNHEHGERETLYTFREWEKSGLEGLYISDILDEFDENLILKLKALYDEQPMQYKITWVDGNGKEIYHESYLYNQIPSYNIDIYGTPEKQETQQYSYHFIGWEPELSAVTQDMTYTAIFNQSIKIYKVTWLDGKNEIIYQENLKYGEIPVFNSEKYTLPVKKSTSSLHFFFKQWSYSDIVTSDVYIKPIFDWFNNVKIIDQSKDAVESYSKQGVPYVRIRINELNKNKSLKVKIDDVEMLLSSKLIKELGAEGIFEVFAENEEVSLGKGYKNILAFSIKMKLNGEDYHLTDSIKITINSKGGFKDNTQILTGDDEFKEIECELNGNEVSFELLNLTTIVIANKIKSWTWIVVLVMVAVVLICVLCLTLYILNRRKKSKINKF